MPFTEVNGLKLSYEVSGESGSPVILIMGFTMPGDAWRFQVPDLAQHHQVATFDNRGAGLSDAPEPGYTMADMAADTAGLLDALAWDRAHVVGVSMGGMVAQHLALNHRDRIASLSLIATTPGGFWRRLPTLRGLYHFARGILGPRSGRAGATTRLLFPKAYREEVGQDYLDEIWGRDYSKPPSKVGRKGQLKAVMGHDTRKRLSELDGLRTLLVRPAKDILVRPRWNQTLNGLIPGSSLITIDDAGHGVVRQSAPVLNKALLEHFAAADQSSNGAG